MNALTPIDINQGPVITIGGGGFSGASAFLHAANKIQQDWETHGKPNQAPITIAIVEPRKVIGPGDPYEHKTDVQSLNQPAYAMSPFELDPDHFTRHIAQERSIPDLTQAGDIFASRREYGIYLDKAFQEAVARLSHQDGPPIFVQTIQGTVDDASFNGANFDVVTSAGVFQSDSLIIADGHKRNGFLGDLRGQKYYYEEETSPSTIQSLPNKHGQVLIVGSGQTMMDRLGELKDAGYEGNIVLVSRRGVMPWEFKPELYRDAESVQNYELKHFTPEQTRNKNYSELRDLWNQEIGHAESIGCGPVHVLVSYFGRQDEFPDPNADKDFGRIAQYIQAYYGNPTPPHKYKMLEELRSADRLRTINSPMTLDQITYSDADGYAVQMKDEEGQTLHFDAIFNSAGCARTLKDPNTGLIRSPLVAKLDEKGLMRWAKAPGILNPGQQNQDGLYYAGPYAYDGKWGVETFRKDIQGTAETAVLHANAKHERRLVA